MKLWPSREERHAAAAARSLRERRARILIWAALTSILCGMVRFGDPLEVIPQAIRDTIRMHPSNGTVVVVAKDDASAAELGNWPVSRRYDAKVIDNLFVHGAKRVFFDELFHYPTNAFDDNLLGATMAKYPGRVFVGARVAFDRVSGRKVPVLPIPVIKSNAQLVSLVGYVSQIGQPVLIPDQIEIAGQKYWSLPRVLARSFAEPPMMSTPDLSIDLRSAPTISYTNALRDTNISQVDDKDVIISPVSDSLADIHNVFPQGYVPGSYVLVAVAETISLGSQRSVHWLPMYLIAFLFAVATLYSRRARLATIFVIAGFGTILVLPFFLDQARIRADLFPATLVLSIVAIRSARLKKRLKAQREDTLSGLPNPKALQEVLTPEKALVALKIHNFGEIVASLGSEGQANLVNEVATRLRVGSPKLAIYHANDCLLWQSAAPPDELADHLGGLHAMFNLPTVIAGRLIDVSLAFGVDTEAGQSSATRIATVIALADEAAAKGLRMKHGSATRHVDTEWRLSLLSRLEAALVNGEVWVAYQPQLDLTQNRIMSAEALVRWTHPQRGPIAAQDFVLAAERGNRIDRLTWFVMDRAVADAATVNRRGDPFSIGVNLSAKLLDDPNLLPNILHILARHQLPRHLLTVEITESSEIERPANAGAVMRELRATGINVSIDDYGTGFTNLEYLKSVPANEVKIDRQFVTALMAAGPDRLLVDSTIALAHSLGQRVVAEGVEDADVLDRLRAMGCDAVQGYLIGHPVPFAELCQQLACQTVWRRTN